MRSLVAVTAAVFILALVALDADAAHQGTACQVGSSGRIETSDNPDTFRAVAFTTCTPPAEFPDPPDRMAISVFWQYISWGFNPTGASWLKGHWIDGDIYDLSGCMECTTLTSRSNDDVPLPPFMGINCRKAIAIHQIHHHINNGDPLYVWTTTSAFCQ